MNSLSFSSHLLGQIQLYAQSAPDGKLLARTFSLLDASTIFSILLVIVSAFLLTYVVDKVLDYFGEGRARRRLLVKKVQSFTNLGVFIIALFLAGQIFVSSTKENGALLGLGGTVAVALGFAFKDTASSVMAGVIILLDQPFQVGDRVSFQDYYGEVIEIGLRSVTINTLSDDTVSIPNNLFLKEAVASSNAGALEMMVVTEFYIAIDADFEQAKKIVYEAVVTSQYVYLQKAVTILVADEMVESTALTKLTAKAYVVDGRHEKLFQTDITERVKRAFRASGVGAPYREARMVA